MEYQDSGNNKIQYNDYSGYFEYLESDQPLRIPKNVKLFKSLQMMIDEYFSLTAQQDLEQLKKDELILEIASTLEQVYINTGQPHLVETIASSLCLILNKKDKITSPSHIYAVLEKKYKQRYSSDFGRSKRGDIFSKRNVMFNDFRESLAGVINFFNNLPNMDLEKQQEFIMLMNKFDESRIRAINELNGLDSILSTLSNVHNNNNTIGNQQGGQQLPEEKDRKSSSSDSTTTTTTNNQNGESGSSTNTSTTTTTEIGDDNNNNIPQKANSKYYNRLEQYIQILQKIKENVLKYPPSRELDDRLDRALELEIELLMPSIDMKFKRSIPQLDETIQYADKQSLNGASSVMHETALVKDLRGQILDPNNIYNKFLEITHKLTPEQIDTRRPYISIIRKKMQRYQPHIFYHLLWYEGARQYNHLLSMGKFARSNLLRKKMLS